MKLKVNPLVVAAALGLIGPAALAEEEDDAHRGSMAGMWRRSGEAPPPVDAGLGEEIQVVELEDRVMLDDGVGGPQGTWTVMPDGGQQELLVEGRRVTRTFAAHGDRLDVLVTVEHGDQRHEYHQVFQREG